MRFVDEVVIQVFAGDGGRGCVAFRREAHVPRGGPSGGDGGRGGDVVIEAQSQLSTLLDLHYQPQVRAERGHHGEGRDCHGRAGASRTVCVPVGTLVYDTATGELLADLSEPGSRVVAAEGGRGGRGNIRFATPTNRAPRRADPGEPGQQRELRLALKLLADVGLVGLPNAGKSTIISRISAARPKIADYPFTTLQPQLGVVREGDAAFVIADIPGLIEGAAQGAGLGHRFLRHVERTRVLVFLVDDRHVLAGDPGSPLEDLALLRRELAQYDPALAEKPALIALNKCDLITAERRRELLELFASVQPPVLVLSATTGEGIDALVGEIGKRLRPACPTPPGALDVPHAPRAN